MNWRNESPALLLIDIQRGLDDEAYFGGNRNNRNAENQCALVLAEWRTLNLPVFHIRHSSQKVESPLYHTKPGFEIKKIVEPRIGEPIITKNVNSAFIGTDLQEQLHKKGISKLIIVGLTTNHCVSTSARMAGNLGFKTIILSDATATFDRIGINGEKYSSDLIHLTTLASLRDEFAEVMTTDQLLKLI